MAVCLSGSGKSLINVVMTSARANAPDYIVRLRGLDPESHYREMGTGKIYQEAP